LAYLLGNLDEQFGELVVGGRIILKWILEKFDCGGMERIQMLRFNG
jgi:hypothetical protein